MKDLQQEQHCSKMLQCQIGSKRKLIITERASVKKRSLFSWLKLNNSNILSLIIKRNEELIAGFKRV